MPKGTFIFIYDDHVHQIKSQFTVRKNAKINTVVKAFVKFLHLCGWLYNDEEVN